jgi:hypothetical protein
MGKRKKRRAEPPLPIPADPPRPTGWQRLAKPWAVIVAVGTVVGALLLNINTILANVRALPDEVHKTTYQFTRWYFQDAQWNGYWTSKPEGVVDAADMNLSSEPVALELAVENGVIDGTIATRQICEGIPLYDFVLLKGRVSLTRSRAWVDAWDTFQGHSHNIARLTLQRDGAVMTVKPRVGIVKYFPPQARVAANPSGRPEGEFCEGKQVAIAKQLDQLLRAHRADGATPPSPAANRRP